MAARRSYGTGSLWERTDQGGSVTFYGEWRADGRKVRRRVGPKRAEGGRDGLTRAQAEREMRRLMAEVKPSAGAGDRLPFREVAARYRTHVEGLGRKRATLTALDSTLRVWLVPRLGDRTLDRIRPEDVEELMRSMREAKVGAKSIRNYIGTLSAIYKFASHPRRRWATVNLVEAVDLPAVTVSDEIHYLTVLEVETLASAAVKGAHQALDRALYVTAAMTGLRQGELIALRWQDVDWPAQRIRVRRSHTLGEFDTPKSKRSSRSVPMSGRVAAELDGWQQISGWGKDGDLVFAEPLTGDVLRRGALMRRYRQALKAAQLEPTFRFHDLRHSFGTAMAGVGVPMRTLMAMMGHEDMHTTLIYADYAPNAQEVEMVDRAFGAPGDGVRDGILSESTVT
jgi:integrase